MIAQYTSPSKTVLLAEAQGNDFVKTNIWSVALPPDDPLSDSYYEDGSNGRSPAGFGVNAWGSANTNLDGAGGYETPPPSLNPDGEGTMAAGTECSDATLAATFSLK